MIVILQRVTLFEWNFVVPQGGVSQGSRVGREGSGAICDSENYAGGMS